MNVHLDADIFDIVKTGIKDVELRLRNLYKCIFVSA